MSVAFYDLKARDAVWQADTEAALLRVARSGRYVLGPEVDAFEDEWAGYCGARHCVGVANALEAMQMVLMAWEIGAGDEVIVPSNTYIATWLAVTHTGAVPVPVEPDPKTHTLDPERIEAAITIRTRAIIPVHLYGQQADFQAIDALAEKHGVAVLYDAAQAHGTRHVGGASAWSFYPSKNLGALGDAGAVTTNDGLLAARVRRLRSYGGGQLCGRLDHDVLGINSRLDELQAAVLRARLPYLADLNEGRAVRAEKYRQKLQNSGLVLPVRGGVHHQYVVRHPHRDVLRQKLAARGVDCHVHYPVPPHRSKAYEDSVVPGRDHLPIAEHLAAEVLSLPIGYDCDVEAVCAAMHEACAEIGVGDA